MRQACSLTVSDLSHKRVTKYARASVKKEVIRMRHKKRLAIANQVSIERERFVRISNSDYAVSKKGNVIRWNRADKRPKLRRGSVPRLKPFGNKRAFVSLSESGDKRSMRIDELVMAAFGPQRPSGTIVVHRDGDPENNKFSNLGYLDPYDAKRVAEKRSLPSIATGVALRHLLKTDMTEDEIAAALSVPIKDVRKNISARRRRAKNFEAKKTGCPRVWRPLIQRFVEDPKIGGIFADYADGELVPKDGNYPDLFIRAVRALPRV